jgi:hypothetical protein
MINKYGLIKKIREGIKKHVVYPATSFYGSILKSVGKNKFVNKIVEPVAALGSMVPFAGSVLERTIKNAPNTAYELGKFIEGVGDGKNFENLLHNYYENTNLVGNPLNSITLPYEGIRALRNVLKGN